MFLAAGLLEESLGPRQDRASSTGAARALPMTFLTLGLGGLSLMGLPPSGGFAAKWLLLRASVASGQWIWALPDPRRRAARGRLRLSHPRAGARDARGRAQGAPQRAGEAVALTLALVALALAFAPQNFFSFSPDRPAGAGGGRRAMTLGASCSPRPSPRRWRCWPPVSSGAWRPRALALQWLAPMPALAAAPARA